VFRLFNYFIIVYSMVKSDTSSGNKESRSQGVEGGGGRVAFIVKAVASYHRKCLHLNNRKENKAVNIHKLHNTLF
jgi:hypothetical protein